MTQLTQNPAEYWLMEHFRKALTVPKLEEHLSENKINRLVVHNLKEEILNPFLPKKELIKLDLFSEFPSLSFTVIDSSYIDSSNLLPRNAVHKPYGLYFLWQVIGHGSYWDDELKRTNIKNYSGNEDTYFCCLNHSMRPYRQKLWESLEKDNLINDYCSNLRQGVYTDIQRKFMLDWSTNWDFSYQAHPLHKKGGWAVTQSPAEFYDKILIDLFVETRTSHVRFTEKTFKPLLHRKLCMGFGGQGMYNELKSMGFMLYEGFIDYQFDDIQDEGERFKEFYKQFKNLLQYPLKELIKGTELAREHNHRRCFEMILETEDIPELPNIEEPDFFHYIKQQSHGEVNGWE